MNSQKRKKLLNLLIQRKGVFTNGFPIKNREDQKEILLWRSVLDRLKQDMNAPDITLRQEAQLWYEEYLWFLPRLCYRANVPLETATEILRTVYEYSIKNSSNTPNS